MTWHICVQGLACPAHRCGMYRIQAWRGWLQSMDEALEALVRQAYARDYLNFGFANWA